MTQTTQRALPVSPARGAVEPLALDQITIDGGFWGDRRQLNRSAILRHAYAWMTRLGWVRNFANAKAGAEYRHRGMQFADSEVYKLIEALSWALFEESDDELQAILDELIATVLPAQDPDGYLHTRFGRAWQAPRYSDFQWGHELYCFGHYLQAAVAHHRTTGRTDLLDSAARLADHVCVMFGAEGLDRVCGHPEIEVALVELYRTTGDQRYLTQANVFIERRGTGTMERHEFGQGYWQDEFPVRETEVFHGHAVRALYLAAGAIDAAVESEDDDLLTKLISQWERTVARRTYLTGGMGSHHMDEAFGEDFVLPPDRSYCETCAGVASIMVAWRLLLATGEARYAELIERTLYNIVATSPSAAGDAFFYANTLHQRHASDTAPLNEDGVVIRGGSAGRQAWFEVSCCPPNVARTLGSLPAYAATMSADGVQVHQLVPLSIRTDVAGGPVALHVATDYPRTGRVTVTVSEAPSDGFDLSLRVPSWAEAPTLAHDGKPSAVEPGVYALVRVAAGSVVELGFQMPVRVTHPDPRIDAVRGTIAFERGPEVLALESVDLPEGWDIEELVATGSVVETDDGPAAELRRLTTSPAAWPYAGSRHEEALETAVVPLVRYHEWAERGPSAMRVFVPLAH